jgi:hypothetical protein
MSLAACVVLAGCGSNGGVPLSKKRLLAPGSELDLIRISEAVWARESTHGVQALSPPERVFLCVWNLEAEVNNGGFDQFFLNSAGDNALDTPRALREIGASQAATIAEEANAVFGKLGPPTDRDTRIQALERLGSAATETLNSLDTKFYKYPDNLEQLLRQYVDRNREEFYAAR